MCAGVQLCPSQYIRGICGSISREHRSLIQTIIAPRIAFYYFDDSGNTQFSPLLARIGDVEALNCFNADHNNSNTVSVVSALVFVEGEGFVDPDHQPAYNQTHDTPVSLMWVRRSAVYRSPTQIAVSGITKSNYSSNNKS